MHIAEGYLPVAHAAFWTAAAVPIAADGMRFLRRNLEQDRSQRYLLGAAAAFAFALSALKLPSVAGSSSHPTGVALGAILFGPRVMSVIGVLVLLLQATLLAHGGLSTLGANVISMAVAGPWAAWAVHRLTVRWSSTAAAFAAAVVGNLATYGLTAAQLGFAHPSFEGGWMVSTSRFLGVFAIAQIPLSLLEGALTVFVLRSLGTLTIREKSAAA